MDNSSSQQALIDLLNSEQLDRESGKKIIDDLSLAFNCFTSYKKLSVLLYERLNRTGKKRLVSIWALCGIYFAWYFRLHGYERWDLRDRHSHELAYKNCEHIEEIFEENSGIAFTISDLSDSEIDVRHFEQLMWQVADIQYDNYLTGAAEEWCCEHPTLRQSFWGGFYEGVIEDMKKGRDFTPNTEHGIAFPFV